MGPIGGSDHPFQMGHGDPFEMGDPTPLLDPFEMPMPKQRNGHISTPRRAQKLSIGPFDAEFHAGALGSTPEA